MEEAGRASSSSSSGVTLSRPNSPVGPSFSRRRQSHILDEEDQTSIRRDFGLDQYTVNEDPFHHSRHSPYPSLDNTRYGDLNEHDPYSAGDPNPSSRSTASLIADNDADDDHTHTGQGWRSRDGGGDDMERSPRSNTAGRYSSADTASPLKRTGTALKRVSQNLRKASLRVVNLAGAGLETQIRLPDDDEIPAPLADTYEPPPNLADRLPIRGRTLGFLGPQSKVRLALFNLLVYPWTEPVILVLIVANAIVLTIQSSRGIYADQEPRDVRGYFFTWDDYALFVLFVIFTIEAFARISVSGLLLDPDVPTSSLLASPFATRQVLSHPTGPLSRGITIEQRLSLLRANLARPFRLTLPTQSLTEKPLSEKAPQETSRPFLLSITHTHTKIERNVPYLRSSWSRIDAVAIVGFWISFAVAMTGLERGKRHMGLFRALSVLRTARLLSVTNGTTTIMHSLKTARPLLTSVAYFVLFAMVLFSVIGIQSFNGSMRRSCYLPDPSDPKMDGLSLGQFCGGFVDPVLLQEVGYIKLDGNRTTDSAKGYVCPLGQTCRERMNPHEDVQSFDAIYYAALQIVIVASATGWSQLMYSMIDAETHVATFFFIICVIVLNFWLINLFVAVITNAFSSIRAQTQKSAFGAAPPAALVDDQDDGWAGSGLRKPAAFNMAKVICSYLSPCWIFLALFSLGLQATRTIHMTRTHIDVLYWGELVITLLFDLEIVLRLLASLPDWRKEFFGGGLNWFDLVLAVGSSIIQIPAIRRSEVYPWFTILQLARFYRVILVIPRMKPLLLAVFGNMYGLANMALFLILINYIVALMAVQMIRGDLSADTTMNFGHVYNGFLAIYQIFTSENWTNLLYDVTDAEIKLGQGIIITLFMVSWMLLANFILLQMFIAVITENFDVAEELKRGKQAANYWATRQPEESKARWISRLNPYRWLPANPVKVKVDNLPSNLVLPIQKTLIQDYDMHNQKRPATPSPSTTGPRHYPSKSLTKLQRLFVGDVKSSNDIAMDRIKHGRHDTEDVDIDHTEDEIERQLALLASINTQRASSQDFDDALYERKAQQIDFIRNHPTYDRTFWFFSQKNPLRRACQKLVHPANGDRIFGTPPSAIAHPIFQLLLLLTVIGGIAVEAVATPVYRRTFYDDRGAFIGSWFDIVETAFGGILVLEFVIKIIADGLAFTPNSYLRSIWNVFDLFILIGVLVNVSTALLIAGGFSRFSRSLKALRALRLITLVDRMRTTFESLLISGAARIVDAAVLSILYLIPYAVWGLNIFSGRMGTCNDDGASGLTDCYGTFQNGLYDDDTALTFLVPRVWDDPAPSTKFSFDSFRDALLILFEVTSTEGWSDVMGATTSIVGPGLQPQTNASQAQAIFMIVFHLSGALMVGTLFVSIIIGNFSAKTGSAYLTGPQREWIDLKKLFARQKPSKRPITRPKWRIRAWCFDRAINKKGWWARTMTCLFFVHIFALMTQTFETQNVIDTIRTNFFLAIAFIYVIDTLVRFIGLGFTSFRANGWNMFDVFVSVGSFITTLNVRFGDTRFSAVLSQKLFLVVVAFKLVQRSNSLNLLFKTAVASLPAILSLLVLWIILFLFFAIMFVEVFSLTKWGSGETHSLNFMTLGNAMVFLAFMSTGEGWNQYMHDYTVEYPRCTSSLGDDLGLHESDCGSTGWALFLFIFWNLISMYIVLNMFTGVVVENFSYFFQSGGIQKALTRDEMRNFKKIWTEIADGKFLARDKFVKFFGRLTGVFEVRVYPAEYSIRRLRELSASPNGGIDTAKLNDVLQGIDYAAIRKRRATYSRLYHEALTTHPERGMSFPEMLMLLAHHKFIVDHESLILEDLVQRTEVNKLVTDRVNLDRVRSLLEMLSIRRRYLAKREYIRLERLSQDIPSIIVDTMPSTPPSSSRDISSGFDSAVNSPSFPPKDKRVSDVSFSPDLGTTLQRSTRHTSDISMLSADLGYRMSRDPFSSAEDGQDVLTSMQNSIWGDMMLEATDEEDKKT